MPAETKGMYAIPRLEPARLVRVDELPGKMSGSQASHDYGTMGISGASAGVIREAYKEPNFSG